MTEACALSFATSFRRCSQPWTLIFVTGYLYVQIPKGFFPQQDTGFIFGEVDTREDASFLSTAKIRQQIVDIVRKDPAVAGVFSFAGAYSYNPTENTARVFMQLKPFDERDVSPTRLSRACGRRWRLFRCDKSYAGGTGHYDRGASSPKPSISTR